MFFPALQPRKLTEIFRAHVQREETLTVIRLFEIIYIRIFDTDHEYRCYSKSMAEPRRRRCASVCVYSSRRNSHDTNEMIGKNDATNKLNN